ncbi:hypothetical protein K2173_003307 [Erythroxylum novogranatense]|uniref:Secreted protein n=1 Tax=Erythroxylum novogranatense TaxID=1862640 RepID=A0AAV8SYE2_9ROSI|nr:hypothetical protein K2173_003307 [Erythroxylum novogranatense]
MIISRRGLWLFGIVQTTTSTLLLVCEYALGVNRDGSHRRLTRVDLYGLDWYSGNVRRKRQLYRCGV